MSATTVAPSTRIGHVAPQALGTVLITGGSSGLGAATAAAVQAAGGTPLVLDRVAPESSSPTGRSTWPTPPPPSRR